MSVEEEDTQSLYTVIPLMICCGIATLSNCFVCYLILTVRRLKTTTNVFVLSLCVCDILFAAVLIPVHCFYQQSLLYLYLVIISVLVYIGNLTAATYERLYSIIKPLHYHMVMTKKKAIQIITVAWLAPFSYCLLPLLWDNDQSKLVHKIYMIGTLILFLLGPLIFIMFVYIKVCLEIKKMYDYKKTIMVANQDENEVVNRSKKTDSTSFQLFCSMICCGDSKHKKRSSTRGSVSQDEKYESVITYNDEISTSTSLIENNTINPIVPPMKKYSSSTSVYSASSKKLIGENISKAFIPRRTRSGHRKSSMGKVRDKMQELKASFAFGIVAMTYMFTWLPVVAMTLLQVLEKHALIPHSLALFSIFSIALNAFTDPFLYALLLENFRKTLRKIFFRRRR